ncbi:MAG TPA: TolC family protein, partial [Armatimonadota bacterium]|nr:TolC family protein [Armatimonadota bacterium]
AGVASAKAQLNSALANLERLKRSIRLEVETAWLRLRQSAEAIAAAEASQTESQAALDAAERRYQADVGILLEITDGRATATSADISVVNAHYDYNTALADLDRSIGTDLTPSNPPGE